MKKIDTEKEKLKQKNTKVKVSREFIDGEVFLRVEDGCGEIFISYERVMYALMGLMKTEEGLEYTEEI